MSISETGQNGNGKHPPGRPPAISPIMEREILAILKAGCSLNDAADLCEIGRSTLSDKLREDKNFRNRVDRAVAFGKTRLIKKVGSAKPWQAAAWMLERKWGEEFGKKEVHEHAGTIRHTHEIKPAMARLMGNPDAYESAKQLANRISDDN